MHLCIEAADDMPIIMFGSPARFGNNHVQAGQVDGIQIGFCDRGAFDNPAVGVYFADCFGRQGAHEYSPVGNVYDKPVISQKAKSLTQGIPGTIQLLSKAGFGQTLAGAEIPARDALSNLARQRISDHA